MVLSLTTEKVYYVAAIYVAVMSLTGLSSFAIASEIRAEGIARIIDGDTIVLEEQIVRIHGIDAPETGQLCLDGNHQRYRCGDYATHRLKVLIGDDVVACIGSEYDKYGRLIGRCTCNNRDIGRLLISEGVAIAFVRYSLDYVGDEKIAREQRVGLWSGEFQTPWDYRAERWRESAQTPPDPNCPIKGNINRKGERIYHMPWSDNYDRTRVDTSQGERWFCSESEALEAGWRAPFW